MLKQFLVLMNISVAFYMQAQDVSIIKNTVEVYSSAPMIGSAKFNAMASSNGALGGDTNSLLTNPAGLGVAISGEASGTLSILENKNRSSLSGSTIAYGKTKGNLGNMGGVITFPLMTETEWKFINIGINFSHQSLDNVIKSPGNNNIIYAFDKDDITKDALLAGHIYERYGNLSKMSFGLGANYNHSLYIGAGFNFFNVLFDQYDSLFLRNLNNNSTERFSKQDSPFSERSSGFSSSLGVIGKLSPILRVGASIETPIFWTIDRNYYFYNDSVYGDAMGVENRKFTSPLKATMSAAFVLSKHFSLNVDYTLGFTKPNYKVYGNTERVYNDFFKENYKNISDMRVGAEYRVQQLRLRGGYSYQSTPFNILTISRFDDAGNIGDQSYSNMMLNDKSIFSCGIGYDFKAFYVDASYQNISSKYTNPFMRGYMDSNSDTSYYSANKIFESKSFAASDVESKKNNFFLTVGWRF